MFSNSNWNVSSNSNLNPDLIQIDITEVSLAINYNKFIITSKFTKHQLSHPKLLLQLYFFRLLLSLDLLTFFELLAGSTSYNLLRLLVFLPQLIGPPAQPFALEFQT
jgi:hypothetical protein